MSIRYQRIASCLMCAGVYFTPIAQAEIAATHIYHNHMPNFWPYYDVMTYAATPIGASIRYTYDGQVVELKKNPGPDYSFYIPGSGQPMPHDDLISYYSHHAKRGAYLNWPMETVNQNRRNHPLSQTHVTMSGSVINNVQSFAELGNLSGYNLGWGSAWRNTQNSVKTANGFNALDTINFSGHHSMGPLVGRDYLLKDIVYQRATLAQPYFIGSQFKKSKGFFPTELGFSERIIPTLSKLDIEWSVLGNVHYSRTLQDYPYLNDPGVDTLISPPNRADLQNESSVGRWKSIQMFNEQQVTHNKFPFASIPHWVQYVDPETAQVYKVAGIPVEQASSWEEGYQGSVSAGFLKEFEGDARSLGRQQYFVIAHDGDNSSGRAGDGGTWANSGRVTYAESGVTGMGVEEYLRVNPIPANDVVHVQDGSWIDTRDSSADPTWYHWHLPMGVWDAQLSAFNTANGTNFPQLFAENGSKRSHMPSLEMGYHYLERNFALLQAAENYAKTAEQIWLDSHPNYWSPSSTLDREVTYSGNQLNPWMMSYPVKGDENNDYAGGANPAELAWYFLIASIDSGFGYYDENVDDNVKPTISFNQSLYFSKPYVADHRADDRTGPSIWWPQRYPYNPGSVNNSKAEGWATMYMNTTFAIYTYAFDVSGLSSISVKVREHKNKSASATDKTYQLYHPERHANDPNVNPNNVGEWASYPLQRRDLSSVINGVPWQPSGQATFNVVPAEDIGDLYYAYFNQYQDTLLDYYIEARDSRGNITRSDIQQVYVGTGRYRRNSDGKLVEDINGPITGEHPFFTDDVSFNLPPQAVIQPGNLIVQKGDTVVLDGRASNDDDGEIVAYQWSTGESTEVIEFIADQTQIIELTVTDNEGASNSTSVTITLEGDDIPTDYDQNFPSLYFRGTPNNWGTSEMVLVADHTWQIEIELDGRNNQRYKVDLYGDWRDNYGDNNGDGVLDGGGGDIYTSVTGVYRLTVNDETLSYQLEQVSDGPDDELRKNFSQLYFRGTPNGWGVTEMSLIDHHRWAVLVDFSGQSDQRFKVDVNGDWSENYGDNQNDGRLDGNGADIYTSVRGRYWVEVNDQTMSYSIRAE
ncbi:PKD domain-containing protein [Marinibactrum halimedae]|uniref:Uncharacterized protein n=1 Tax=Marinibactrum halimedae TaxID=1444977 RepID=A0AA37WQP1_9GAMM|nr:hypothetical protein [Marinibactrum halimedae]MCD9457966.1 hypothetical protein [Marinibactrum halimedae]GLS27592.1 hypothetical protein GCM10007877_33110 [Marinibactrum halimedae]